MTPPPWTQHQPVQSAPAGLVGPAGERGYGRADRSRSPRHASTGTQGEAERHATETDRHDEAPADRPDFGTADRPDFGTADRPGTGTAPALPISTADQHDLGPGDWHDDRADADADADAATHHIVMPNDEPRADVVRVGGRADAEGDGPAQRRYPLIGRLRVWDEEIRLRDLLRIARRGNYNLSHIPMVRAANTAFFWLVTAPVVTAAFCFLWAFAVSFHRALTIAGVVLVAAQAVPIVPWLVVATWSAATWQGIGAALLVFGVGTAIAAAAGRTR